MRQILMNQFEKISSNDINNMQLALNKCLYDDVFFNLFGGLNGCVGTAFSPSYVSAYAATLAVGIGFFFDSSQISFNPKYRLIQAVSAIPVTFATAHASLDRIDLVCLAPNFVVTSTASRYVKTGGTGPVTLQTINKTLQDSYTLQVVTGTPGVSPVAPALPSGHIAIQSSYIHAATGMTGQSDITDLRVGLYFVGAALEGILTLNEAAVSQVLTANQTLTWPNLVIPSGKTITVPNSAYLLGMNQMTVSGTLVVTGSGVVKLIA